MTTKQPTSIELAEAFQRLQSAAPEGEYELWTGCSWRRVGIKGTLDTVIEPCYYSSRDRHPDLKLADGVVELLAAARNTDIPARLIEAEREVERLKKIIELTKPLSEQDQAFWQHIVDQVISASQERIA